jgi:hypothetical protein
MPTEVQSEESPPLDGKWFWKDNNTWIEYNPILSKKLEEAFQNK